MNKSSDFPEIAFKCPKVWSQMRGDEKTRFCDVCNRQVHNLSMMSGQERRELLTAEGESPCVAYFKELSGAAIDVTTLSDADPLKHLLTKAAALSLSTALSLLPSCTTLPEQSLGRTNMTGFQGWSQSK